MAQPEKKKTHAKPGEKNDEQSSEKRHDCLICGKLGSDTICEHCKIVVQAEALSE